MNRLAVLLCAVAVLPNVARCYSYQTKYLDVPVDHFNFGNNATFRLRYLVNDTHWRPDEGRPIFFYTGNEGDISMFAQNTGFVWEIAPQFGALVVFAEHRYYGQSLPFGNKSYSDPQHLGFLTSQQALADYVVLIAELQRPQRRPSPVVAFGGSYGGMLSAYLRLKYPASVVGAIAASAPVLQFPGLTPCGAFARIVTSDFASVAPSCADSIRRSWSEISNLTSSDAGRAWLSTAWRLCKPLASGADVSALKAWLADVYTNLAMINYPYATEFLAPVPAHPVAATCAPLGNATLGGKLLMRALFKAVSVYFNHTGRATCLDVGSSASGNLGDRGWDFQSCTEMVMPMCSDGQADMFEPQAWNFAHYSDGCHKRWGVRPSEQRAVLMYGGKELSTASNIVFSNGLLDPWSSGGVLRNVSDTALAIIIPEGAHHLDLRESNPADPPAVRAARQFHCDNIRTWIEKHQGAPPSDKPA